MCDYMVQLVNVSKVFESNEAVSNVSMDIKKGEFLTLLGPSGCGKTTTLRMIAGFEQPTGGMIFLDGEQVDGKQPYERNVNTVFQNYALFPHMTVFENIAFGLRMKKLAKEQVRDRVRDMLQLVQLEGYENRKPEQLSGGQKQRVAIARALVNNPKVLLLDEPLGALDLKLRKQMQLELKSLQRKLGITFVYVTHDQEEALTMSDRIAVMDKGKIQQMDSPFGIYEKPCTKFVAQFIGETNLFEGKISHVNGGLAYMKLEDSEVPVPDKGLSPGETVFMSIRPEKIKIRYWVEEGKVVLRCFLKERIYAGSLLKTILMLPGGQEVIVNEPTLDSFMFEDEKSPVYLNWEPEDAVVMKT